MYFNLYKLFTIVRKNQSVIMKFENDYKTKTDQT